MNLRVVSVLSLSLLGVAQHAGAQAEYRNLDGGFPVRIEDATVTERYALDLDLANLRFDALSAGRRRVQIEPRLSYGILPRSEVWLRATAYYREAAITPRKGLAGVGVGGMYQFNLEHLGLPATAISSEAFIPTGPGALPASYSLRALLTKSFATGRIHINASIASYATRVATGCLPLISGSVCPSGATTIAIVPPLDGPCVVGLSAGEPTAMVDAHQTQTAPASATAETASERLVTHGHWLVGVAADKTLPLRSIVFIEDVFAERFEGIGRPVDWTDELGARKQVSPRVVVVGAVGRHFSGLNQSSFLILGATLGRALQLFGR
ncbi:MAG: hypothetical protein ACREMS_00540 [Gemmatimonadaceae bacterium]